MIRHRQEVEARRTPKGFTFRLGSPMRPPFTEDGADHRMRLWIKDPLAILAPTPSAESSSKELRSSNALRAAGRRRLAPEATFNASRHVVLPGLINAHHHFYQTLTRAHPAGFGKELIPWLVTMERVWGRMTPEALAHRGPDGAGRTDAVRLHDRGRSSQSLSAGPRRTRSTSRSRRRRSLACA